MERRISWMKGALKQFGKFPEEAQEQIMTALALAARGELADIAKPMKGLGSGIYEVALKHKTDAYRAIYAVQVDEDIWVLHAFQKKSPKGIKTAQKDVDLIRERIKRLKEALR